MGNEPRPQIPPELFVVDEPVRGEYYYLEPHDTCFYIWERMSRLWSSGQRPDYTQYPVNQLISNLQILPSVKTAYPQRHYWKELAISYAANTLAQLIPEEWLELDPIFVPIPPSKPKDDPEYDIRLVTTLDMVRPKLKDIRPLVLLDSDAFDTKQKGLKPTDRAAHYLIDETFADPEPEIIILFDDILTTGCHFKAMEIVLKKRFPEAWIFGLFLARTVRPTEEGDVVA